MKELFRDRDLAKIERCRALLEEAGIQTFLKNESLATTVSWIMEFDPTLSVVNDEDYERAVELLRQYKAIEGEAPVGEIACSNCGEKNPGTFSTCWNCEQPLREMGNS